MYKIRHKKTKLYFSTSGCRYISLLNDKNHLYYNDRTFLSKHGKVWSIESGPQRTFRYLNRLFPDVFEIVKFVEEI